MLTAGSKLAQAGAYDRAYPWLDQLLQLVATRTPATPSGRASRSGCRRASGTGFVGRVAVGPYSAMVKSKNCTERRRSTIVSCDGKRRWSSAPGCIRHGEPDAAERREFEAVMPQVKKQFKCKNF